MAPRKPPFAAALAVAGALLALYLLTFGGHLYSPDEEILFRQTEALATRASRAVEPLAGFATRPGLRDDGLEYPQYGIAQPLAAVPLHAAGQLLYKAASPEAWAFLATRMRADYPLRANDDGQPIALQTIARGVAARLVVSLCNTLITPIAAAVLLLLAWRLTANRHAAILAALAWGAGSIAWPHARTFFTEPLAGLCVLLAFERLAARFTTPDSTARGGLRREGPVFVAGAATAIGILTRIDTVVFMPALAALALVGDADPFEGLQTATPQETFARVAATTRRPASWLRAAAFLCPVAVAGGAMMALNALAFGHPLASAYSDQPEGIAFTTPVLAGLYGFLFSVGRGMFFFSPVLIIGLLGLRPMLRRRPVIGAALLLAIISFLVFHSAWRNWAGGWCWGPRHIYQIHALLAAPIAFWAAERWTSPRRVLYTALLTVAALIQVYGCSQNFIEFYRIHFQDPRPPSAHPLYDVAANQAITRTYRVLVANPEDPGQFIPVDPRLLPAPINDSVYIVQNSQWPGNWNLWKVRGVHDFFWLHLFED